MRAAAIIVAAALLAPPVLSGCSDEKPGLLGYEKKTKRIESRLMLDRLIKSAKMYFIEEHVGPGGAVAPPQFPGSVSQTPPMDCCKSPNGKCPAEMRFWQEPSWEALGFAMDDPHYYTYEVISSGSGPTATFTARALGNLDCDDTIATFEMSITGADVEGGGTGPVVTEINPLD